MDLIFDIETNGLLRAEGGKPEGTLVHCICFSKPGDLVESYYGSPERIALGLRLLAKADRLIGHNIQGFDLPYLKKILGWEYHGQVFDTLVCSRLAFPDIKGADLNALKSRPDYPKELIGRHSLEAWGWRLNKHKGKINDYEKFSQEMLYYCVNDVKVTAALFEYLQGQKLSPESVALEHQFSEVLDRQMARGVGFDMDACHQVYGDLKTLEAEYVEKLKDVFPPFVKKTQLKTKVREEIIPFNPRSTQQIARNLKAKYGWSPKEFTKTGLPKVSGEILRELPYPEAAPLADLAFVRDRIATLVEGQVPFIGAVKKDGRLYHFINHNGTATGRCSHSNPNVNVPKVKVDNKTKKPLMGTAGGWGYEMRSCFVPTPGWSMVGADASSLELRCLAHYMAAYDGGKYAKALLEGDIHSTNQEAAGLPTRDLSKEFIYAFLYGAGDPKLGWIVSGSAKDGKELRKRFLSKLPALSRLLLDVQTKAEQTGYLVSLDRRRVKIRTQHSALNFLLQAAGAVVMKKATCLLDETLASTKFGGLPGVVPWYGQVLHVHDEVQFEVHPTMADFIGKAAVEAITQAGEYFKMKCPMAGEYRVGKSWAETH